MPETGNCQPVFGYDQGKCENDVEGKDIVVAVFGFPSASAVFVDARLFLRRNRRDAILNRDLGRSSQDRFEFVLEATLSPRISGMNGP